MQGHSSTGWVVLTGRQTGGQVSGQQGRQIIAWVVSVVFCWAGECVGPIPGPVWGHCYRWVVLPLSVGRQE